MKKSTIFLLVGVVVLAVVAFFVTKKSDAPQTPKLGLRGFATVEQLAAEKTRGMLEAAAPIAFTADEIIIERDPANPKAGTAPKIRIVKDGEGEAAKWRLVEPVEAPAQKYQVERIVQTFKAPLTSKFSRALKDGDLARYDLEPARRVHLTIKSKGQPWQGLNPDPSKAVEGENIAWQTVDLIVGRVEKGEQTERGDVAADTWVTTAADPKTAYLMAGKDLRQPLDVDMSALRDRKVFTLDPNDLTRLEIVDPDGKKIVLAGTRTETPAPPPEEGEAPPPEPPKPTVKVTWAISEPAGLTADASVEAYARSFASLTAQEFVPLASASDEAKKAIGGRAWTITADASGKDGAAAQKIVLKVAEGEGDTVWAQIQGQAAGKEELIQLASHSAKGLRKGLDELENRVVFDITPENVRELTVKEDTGGIITVSKSADGKSWTFSNPVVAYPADPTNLLRQVAKLQATRWAKPSERDAALAALGSYEVESQMTETSGTTRVVRFAKAAGGDEGDKSFWGVVVDPTGDTSKAKPFLAPEHVVKRYTSSIEALRLKKMLNVGKADIAKVEITSADGKETFVLEQPPAEPNGPPKELAVMGAPAGKQTKEEAARTLGSTLGALDAKSFHDGKAATETGLEPGKAAKVVVTTVTGEVTTVLISTKKPSDTEVYAVVDKGPLANVPVGMNEYQSKNLTRALAEYLEDAAPAPVPDPAPVPAP